MRNRFTSWQPSFRELVALKVELSKLRKQTARLRERLAALGLADAELPELSDVQPAYAAIGREIVSRRLCPCFSVCAKAQGKAVSK
ncbi:hypothetical protein [Victivallis sp. Marseille-Q1083]|uniref:hypothetical protein n=1 Tax=Victivallis sp. Marseille-Q1083 TaxID=2717288 RepID=UPI00158B107F|nr:hypothetical protein [Victivallis sp. Marseille-Q1083]